MLPLTFLSSPGGEKIASQKLRLYQMVVMLQAQLKHPVTIDELSRPSVVICPKFTMMRETETIKRLYEEGKHYLVSDIVDSDLYKDEIFNYCHAHIAAGYAQGQQLKKITDKPVYVIPHGLDQELYIPEFKQYPVWRLGYIGSTLNTKWLQEFGILYYDPYKNDKWFYGIAQLNLHWCVRECVKPEKPFTKGIMAGFSHSPAVLLRGDSDARYWLPDDYPLYCDDNIESAAKALDYARSAWGTPEWQSLVEPFEKAHEKVMPENLSKFYLDMLEQISEMAIEH